MHLPSPHILIDTTNLWTLPPEWMQNAAVIGVIVMQGEASIALAAAPIRLKTCTATFIRVSQATTIRLNKATIILWRLDEDAGRRLSLGKIHLVDETTATVMHDVFFAHQRPEAHQVAALHLAYHQLCDANEITTVSAPHNPLVAGVTEYLQEHLDMAITLTDLEREFGYSKTVISRGFKAEHNATPMQILARLRMANARHLLQNSELTISQIGQAVGYRDVAGFSHFFNQHAKQSPSEFRSNCHWLV